MAKNRLVAIIIVLSWLAGIFQGIGSDRLIRVLVDDRSGSPLAPWVAMLPLGLVLLMAVLLFGVPRLLRRL